MLWLVFSLIALFLLATAFIMPWVNYHRLNRLENALRYLLKDNHLKQNSPSVLTTQNASDDVINTQIQTNIPVEKIVYANPFDIPDAPQETIQHLKQKPKVSFEEQFGKKLPVWIGGIALALAAFFLVKYSVDNNLLSPVVRVLLGGGFGIALLQTAQFLRQKPNFANGQRIAQSLAGAGIVALYVVIFAASKLYDLVPIFMAFVGMGVVTAVALVMSLRHGMPIALMALTGGFLTPVFLSSGGHHTAFLFGYLYLMVAGLNYIVKKTNWWWLSVITTLASLLWVIIGLSFYQSGDGLWLALFLMGVSCLTVFNSKTAFEENNNHIVTDFFKPTSLLNYISLFGSIILMGVVVKISGFGFLEWGLLTLLALATIGLAYFNDRVYGFAPWVSVSTIFMLLVASFPHNPAVYFLTLALFGMVYILSSCVIIFQSRVPVLWACLAGITSIAFYLLAFAKLQSTDVLVYMPLAWGFLAMILASGAIYMLVKIADNLTDSPYKEYLYGVFSTVATSFITLGLYIELPYEFLSVAIATQMLAIAWINQKISIKALQKIIAILASVFGLILLPQFLLMIQLTVYSLTETQWHLQASLPMVKYPLFQLGIPAVMFLCTGILLQKTKHNPLLIKIFESVSIGLIAIMGYYLTRNILNPNQNVLFVKAGFFERGLISNVLFLYGLLCLWIGRIYNRMVFSWGGIALVGAGLFRIIYFDIVLYNPLWETQKIGGIILLNSLILPYCLPIIWAYFIQKELAFLNKNPWNRYLDGFKLMLLFVFLSLNIRHIFHGAFLNTGLVSNLEIYSYSVLWLLLGGGLLYAGTLKHNKMVRLCSLGIIVLAVGKVFLYDAAELEGLYRVFSFLGLGISLIGVSYFYSRFIVYDKNGE